LRYTEGNPIPLKIR